MTLCAKFLGGAIFIGVAAVCGPPENGATSRLPCQAPGDSVIFTAVKAYVEQVSPKPRRFLVTIGDSTLPDGGRAALQQKGPMYLYPASAAQVDAFRKQLAAKGNLVTLLVSYGGVKQLGDARAIVQLGGSFVGGALDGQHAPARAVHFRCDAAQWRYADIRQEKSA